MPWACLFLKLFHIKFICLYYNFVYNSIFFLEKDEIDTDSTNPEGDKYDTKKEDLNIVNLCEEYRT